MRDAKSGRNIGKKLYFGAIPKALAEEIEKKTGVNVEGYNCSIAAQEVRKIFKDHGDDKTENPRGQRAITEEDFVNIPTVIQSFDAVTRSKKDYNGRPVINFTKDINGKVTVTAYVSKKHIDLTVQTMFSSKKNRNLATPIGEQAPINTPEASSGTVPNNSISISMGKSNPKISEKAKRSRESEYLILAKDPEANREKLQAMVDEAAEKAMTGSVIRDEDGNLLTVYHGGTKNYTVFDRTKGRSTADIQGTFFSPWEEDAQGYGLNVRKFYINLTNPATEAQGYKALNKFKGQNYAGIKAREYLESLGFDGVGKGENTEEYIVFNPENIKSADPVTYDDSGNVIPLSERFNSEKTDIRYSREYIACENNEEIIRLVHAVKNGTASDNSFVDFGVISGKAAERIKEIYGRDVTGYKVKIEARQIKHILKGHGENGISDHSMKNDADIAKMEYVITNFDSIVSAGSTNAYYEFRDGKNRPAKTVLYEKTIGNKSYYTVEAVPNSKKKTLYIVTAFIGKRGYKKESSQFTDAKSPSATPKSVAAKDSTNSIHDSSGNSKRKNSIERTRQTEETEAHLRRVNTELQWAVQYWRRQANGRPELKETDLMKVAADLTRAVHSVNAKQSAMYIPALRELYTKIAADALTAEEAKAEARTIAAELIESAEDVVDPTAWEDAKDIRRFLRDTPEELTGDMNSRARRCIQ